MASDTIILGISCFYHDSAAALIVNGKVVAAAQEERFSRKKHDSAFPTHAIQFCLSFAKISIQDVHYVVYYEKPFLKLERLLRTYISTWPWGLVSFLRAMIVWTRSKLWVGSIIRRELNFDGEVLYAEHHYAHAASAYYCSGFSRSAIVTMDAVGEWDTATIGYARGNSIILTHSIIFPHSLGLLYSAVTSYLGFEVNSDEYKVMGLAPYGDPQTYLDRMRKLVTWNDDGSFALNTEFFAYTYDLRMTSDAFHSLFGGAPRKRGDPLGQREKDIAAALQKVTEEIVLSVAAHAKRLSGESRLCLAGGVALNCVANGKIAAAQMFDEIYIQPAAGDAGGAIGAALYVYYDVLKHAYGESAMPTAFLGPHCSPEEIRTFLEVEASRYTNGKKPNYTMLEDDALFEMVAGLIEEGAVIGWFQGRMEFGPRALGNRSILADPRDRTNLQRINQKIKFREDFRPLAPAVLDDHVRTYFALTLPSPHMLLVANVITKSLPAVTHIDGSARVQTVRRGENERFYRLIEAFHKKTGCAVLINTSMNVAGEPIVSDLKDAFLCFLHTDLDYVVLGNAIIAKKEKQHRIKPRSGIVRSTVDTHAGE